MPIRLSPRLDNVRPSLTLSLDDRVRSLQAAGKNIINLTVGQPDFDTPAWIGDAARAAITRGATRYTSPIGTLPLRQAAAAWFRAKTGLDYTAEEILVSSGSKHAIYNALQALLVPGDKVIVPSPFWSSYPDLVHMAGGVPVHPAGTLESGWKLTPALLDAAITPKTRVLLINSPNNPTGALYHRGEAEALARVILERDIAVISDKIYDRLVYDNLTPVSFAAVLPGMRARTIAINGVSKAYAMTGWRIGFAAGPPDIIEGMGRYQAQATSNPSSISQEAALAALTGTGPELETMLAAYQRRRDAVVAALSSLPGVELVPPDGAFYVFFRVRQLLGRSIGGVRF
ncbi:MAG TPA: pyridoxal phosphate-dependent aminotransferase, partial [Candidatus Eisenbacteria bacterium]